MTWVNRNEAWAAVFVDELARSGIREVCLSPGSRSTPLVLALTREPRVRTFVHLDERSAAYFALGIAKATGRPAAVLTTSGTAAGNLFPAVIEATQGETPLLLLTADRPHRLRGQDANQTIDQIRLFGPYARFFHDVAPPVLRDGDLRYVRGLAARAVAAAMGPPGGAAHLNFPFDKPLEPTPVPGDVPAALEASAELGARGRAAKRPFTAVERGRSNLSEGALDRLTTLLLQSPRGLLVCGPTSDPWRLGPAALRLARVTGYPLLADPLSGARFRPGATECAGMAYDLLLRNHGSRPALAPDLILRSGPAGSSASLDQFLALQTDATQIVVDAGGRWKDHRSVASHYFRADAAETFDRLAERLEATIDSSGPLADRSWSAEWERAEQTVRSALETELAGDFFEGAAVAAVAATLPANATLFVGNSMPVRDLESFTVPRDEPLVVLANRGASGIDGTVSSALGAAVTSQGPTVAVLGDLALYHDMNGLLAARRFGIDICFVILNNDGGGIFHFLPIREFEPAFTQCFVAPHGLDFRHTAILYDLQWEQARTRDELLEALDRAVSEGGRRIIEVPSDGAINRARREAVADAVHRAATHHGP